MSTITQITSGWRDQHLIIGSCIFFSQIKILLALFPTHLVLYAFPLRQLTLTFLQKRLERQRLLFALHQASDSRLQASIKVKLKGRNCDKHLSRSTKLCYFYMEFQSSCWFLLHCQKIHQKLYSHWSCKSVHLHCSSDQWVNVLYSLPECREVEGC